MDSLTHLVLGAAIGEIVLGKKIGNRALIWGAIGETIPDLDVFGNLFLDPIDALAFHRGITHSILFSFIAPLIFGGVVYKLYHSDSHRSWPYKILISILNAVLIISLVWGINYVFSVEHHPRWWLLLVTVSAGSYLGWRLYKYYLMKDLESPKTTFRQWYLLFFLTFFTHIMLDSCTTFGTQLLLPFSNVRVAFNTIAVADPFYTIPFLVCAVIFPFLKRGSKKRALFNWIGLGISSAYLIFTIFNKFHVDQIFDKALHHRGIEVTRCRTSPTILNNILWTCLAEDSSTYYVGQYSLFDSDPNLHHLNEFPKNDSIQQVFSGYEDYQTLLWFSNGYLTSFPTDSMIMLADLRYGGMYDTIRGPQDLIFKFKAIPKNGSYEFTEFREPFQDDFGEVLMKFIRRIKGY